MIYYQRTPLSGLVALQWSFIIGVGWIPKIQDFFRLNKIVFQTSITVHYDMKNILHLCFCPVLRNKFLFSSRNHYTNHYIRDIRRCTMQGIEISITWFKALAWLQNINKISSGSIRKVFKIHHMMYKRHKQWKIKWVLYYKMQFLPLF